MNEDKRIQMKDKKALKTRLTSLPDLFDFYNWSITIELLFLPRFNNGG